MSFLLDNLDTLEKLVADLDALKLERDILLQLGRLGALEFFNACLSRTLQTSNVLDLSAVPTENTGESKTDGMLGDLTGKTVVRTGKKEERKFRRERAASDNGKKTTSLSLPSKTVQNNLPKPTFVKRTSSSSSRRSLIARNEAKMTRGVKVVRTSITYAQFSFAFFKD
jgi:RNA polymerase sigma factor